jgi:arylformamidase
MRIEDYPPQEPFSDFGRSYRDECLRLSEGIVGDDHNYGSLDPSQSLTVYPSTVPNGSALIFLHGGGWTNGYKEEMAFLAPSLNARGITLVSAGYRLAPKHVFPANIEDVADAVAKAFELARQYDIDTGRLFLGGHSAGGHLASHLALRSDWQSQRGLPIDVVKGCLPISGTYDFTPGCGLSVRPRFLGPEHESNEVPASPIFISPMSSTPFLIAYGANDFPHLVTQAAKFSAVLRARDINVTSLEVGGADHLTVAYMAAKADGPWMSVATEWMRTVTAECDVS